MENFLLRSRRAKKEINSPYDDERKAYARGETRKDDLHDGIQRRAAATERMQGSVRDYAS